MGNEGDKHDLYKIAEKRILSRFFLRLVLAPILGMAVATGFFGLLWILADIHVMDRLAYLLAHWLIGGFSGLVIGIFWAYAAIRNPPQ